MRGERIFVSESGTNERTAAATNKPRWGDEKHYARTQACALYSAGGESETETEREVRFERGARLELENDAALTHFRRPLAAAAVRSGAWLVPCAHARTTRHGERAHTRSAAAPGCYAEESMRRR